MTPRRALVLFVLASLLAGWTGVARAQLVALPVVPPGFVVSVYAKVPGARSLALGKDGTVYVGSKDKGGRVSRVTKDGLVAFATPELNRPNGVAVIGTTLFIATTSDIRMMGTLATSYLFRRPDNESGRTLVVDLPAPNITNEFGHPWRYLAAGPDGWLYVSTGAPCNACESPDEYATIARVRPNGKDYEVVARGVRNSMGFDWRRGLVGRRVAHTLWFTENGADHLGPDLPPDELNRVDVRGSHYGYPYCHGRTPDPVFRRQSCAQTVAPAVEFQAHSAPLGARFYYGNMFRPPYVGAAFVALHGPAGGRVVALFFQHGKPIRFHEAFLTGVSPVDVLVMPDGALLVSDDKVGVIYRVAHEGRR